MALLKDLIVYGASRFIGDVLGSQIYGNGFHHNAHDTDTYFLLAGGGAKALSTIATNDHNHNGSTARTAWGQQYVNASGTLTSISGNMSSVGNIIPSGNNAQNIGSTTNRWAKLYIGTADSYGSATKGIYWDAGVPKACTVAINSGTTNKIAYYSDNTTISSWTSTTGGTVQPIYLNAGVPTALSGSVGGAATPVYLNAGTITKLTGTRGGNKQPVWLNGGEIVASSGSEGSGTQFVYLSSGVITKTTSTVGSSTKPIYLNAGVITECSNMATSSHTHKIKLGGTEITVPAPGTTPTATTLITGPFAINTEANSSKAFSIQRGSSSEGVQHWVDDSEYHIDYTNDEKSSSIHWRIINTDTENPSTPLQTTDFHVYLDSSGNFRPGTTNTGSIGTASYKWKYIYGTNIYGNLTGNVTGNVTGNSGTSDKIKTVTDSTNANYYLTFVDSNNSTATYESLYTNAGIIFNPNKHSFAQGVTVTASGYCSHAEGSSTKASGDTSHAEGYLSEAQGQFSHAEGQNVRAKNTCSHAEGVNTEAGPYAHAEGSSTKASGDTSHAEGYLSEAQGQFSHAEGSTNRASGWCSHVGGNGSTSSGDQSFAHGSNVIASGWASFAVNANTTASGLCSFVCGQDTQALHNYEFATGHFNLSNSDTIFSVGGGNSNNNRFNLFEVTTGGKVKARDGFYKHNSNNTYILLGGGDHKLLTSLFTNFSNAGNQITSITIGGTTYTLPVDADKLDGFDANNLLSYYKSGTISSNGNTLTQANTYITVGGNTLYTNGSTCNIINSHTASGGQLTSSTNTMSLSAHTDTVNGIDSTISKSSASIINSLSVTGNQISSSVNTMILDPLTVNVNGVTDSTTKSTAQIINSLSVSTLTSTNATNLTAAIIINGVASANKTIIDLIARQIAQTSISSLSSFTNDNNLIYAAAGGSNSVSDKPTDVDAFGVLSFKTAAGWYGQLLMSSNEATGLYWRTATTLSGGWKKLLDSSNYTNYVYSKTDADDRYVLKAGDTMTGTLTLKTTGTGNYNQGIRINRTATNQWALLLIGKSGDSTYGPGTSTAGDGAWLIGTPASSNSLIFNLNDASENKGLCLKGHGNNDIKWNNNNVAHAGNIASSDASISTSLTEIATVAGVSIKAKIGNFSPSGHTHRYINSEGFSDNGTTSLSTWGTLKTANDYTGILQINESNGGSWEIAAKGGQISMQIDGYFYQNEGTYRVTDVSETVTNLYTSGTKLYWTKNGSDTGLTIPYATNAGNADTVDSYHASDLGKVNSYTLPSNKGVRITYPSHTLIIVSVCGTNSGAQLIIIGTGYGEGGRIRNQFTELVSCSLFDWSIPNSNDISRSVEVFSRRDSDSTVKVISTDGVSFTSIDALTSAKENATLLTSSNYTNYTVTKSGTGATGTWGINITGSAESASTATKLTTARTIWGQSFDGTDNVSGNMSSVGNISFSASGKNIGSILYFDTTNSRLGVGKSDPSHKLEVAGNISLYSASGDSPYLYFQRGTTSDSYNDWRINCVGGNLNFNMSSNGTWSTTPLLQLSATAGTAYLNGYTIYHSGNLTYSTLGIKQRIITIDGTEYTFYSPYDTNVTVTTTKVTQTITTSSNTDYRPLIVGYSSSSSITPTFSTTTNSVYATHRLFIQPSTGDLHLYNPDGGDSPALYFQRGDLNTSSTFDYRMYVSNGNLHIQNNQSSWNTLLYIGYDGGKIGIGTTSPSYKLDISGTIHSTDNAYFDSKVGIGTTSPSEKLDVNGNVRIRGNNEYIGTGSGSQCHMQYDDTNKCLNFIFD